MNKACVTIFAVLACASLSVIYRREVMFSLLRQARLQLRAATFKLVSLRLPAPLMSNWAIARFLPVYMQAHAGTRAQKYL